MKNLLGSNYKILERKSSKFGVLGYVDRGNELELKLDPKSSKTLDYYDNSQRLETYRTALDKYAHDQLARPLVNVIVNAIFSNSPDFQGDKKLVDRANKVIEDSQIDWSTLGVDLEVHGDVFLRCFFGEDAKIASLPAQTIEVDCNQNNILEIKGYKQIDSSNQVVRIIDPIEISHLRINNTSNMIYGMSTLRPVFWWLDVLDNLWERNWIRAAQYYGAPIIAISGVPGEYQANVKSALEADGQRPGKNWIFPPDVKIDTVDFTKNYPIQELIDRVYKYILAACNIPQHMIFESDSSRGVAMFSGDSFEMMIRSRQHIWSLGLKKALMAIFKNEGLLKEDELADFRITWSPVFKRDLDKLAKVMKTGMENGILSRQTAREMISIDHSEELKRLEQQKKDEPDAVVDPSKVQNPMEPASKDKEDK